MKFSVFPRSILVIALAAFTLNLSAAPVDRAALATALVQLPTVDYGDPRDPLDVLDRAVAAAHADDALAVELEAAFIAVVLNPRATLAAKDQACRSLRLVGTARSVPALATLLPHPQLSGLARYALEPMPYPEVDAALRSALPDLAPRQQIGVLTSLGERRDAGSVEAIVPLIRQRDEALAHAAVIALGRIGSAPAAQALLALHAEADGPRHLLAAQGCLEAAWSLTGDGRRPAAAGVFSNLFAAHPAGYLHEAAFEGLVAAQPRQATRRLLAALRGDNERLRHLAGRLVVERPATNELRRFLAELPDLPSAGQIVLLDALGRRGNPSSRDAVRGRLQDADAGVRLAAVRALGSVGGPADVLDLAELAGGGRDTASVAARDSLGTLPGTEVDAAIARAALDAGVTAAVRVELLQSLTARNAQAQAGTLVPLLADPDRAVGRTAATVLGNIGGTEEIPAVIRQLATAAEPRQEELLDALELICSRVGEAASAPMLAGIREARGPVRAALLRLLSSVGGEAALAALRAGVADPDAGVKDASVRALAEWREPAALPDLLAIVNQPSTPAQRVLAFRGYVRLVRESGLEPAAKLDALRRAMALARDTDQKRLVVAALGDASSVEALHYAASQLDVPELADEAGAAAVRIANSLGTAQRPAILPVLEAVIAKAQAKPVTDRARELQRKLR